MINVIKRFQLYLITLRYLKAKQIFFQVYYRFKRYAFRRALHYNFHKAPKSYAINLALSIPSIKFYQENSFSFLNKTKRFNSTIDWNFSGYGKLWTYNLNYFEFLHQENLDRKEAFRLLDSYCDSVSNLKDGLEPYPVSLRGINWIKFFSSLQNHDDKYNSILFAHYKHLLGNLEHHLLGNHLLENAFSLLFGAYFFRNEAFYKNAKRLLKVELNEQILDDGAHFELSPMYHQILLYRLLDSINLVKNNPWKRDELSKLLMQKAEKMLGWLKAVTFENGEIPMVNDSAFGIAPSSNKLFNYSNRLGISCKKAVLSASGYRMIRINEVELFIDVGNIGPDYIPGHAHSDTFSYIIYFKKQPQIVDVGVSTYESTSQRTRERSTSSHNTVEVNSKEQSEVWSSFRVGRRARIRLLKEDQNEIISSHDGYQFQGIIHTRKWKWLNNEIVITDEVDGAFDEPSSIAYLHFHPAVAPLLSDDQVVAGSLILRFENYHKICLEDYSYASGFNSLMQGKMLKIFFSKRLKTKISFVKEYFGN